MTVAAGLAQALAEAGVRHMYGVPGGGSSLDLIEAGAALGIRFVLTKTENAAVMMAGAMAETTGVPGVAIMTKGPGVANAVNGVAYAALDRAPVLVVTDGFTPRQLGYITHQVYDQRALLAPLVKGHGRLEAPEPGAEIRRLVELACTPPFGPVHIELTSEVARRPLAGGLPALAPAAEPIGAGEAEIEVALRMLREARRPVAVLGLDARRFAPAALRLVRKLGCPVLPTYKAKGVVPDDDPQVTGVFTGGVQEEECIGQADLVLLIGLDPVEMILQPWRVQAPVLDIGRAPHPVHYVVPAAGAYGDPARTLARLADAELPASAWRLDEIAQLRDNVLRCLAYTPARFGVAPDRLVQLAAEACGRRALAPRMAVDAGAHMFSATAFFPCRQPGDALISNGLASMAFALPAAIAASIEDPARPVLCFTGDGGLMMCMGELCTAVDAGARIIVLVFNDSALSLIDVKQQSRALPSRGVRWREHDFARVMEGAGALGLRAGTEAELSAALERALDADGPVLIDVVVDPAGYPQQLKAMRG
jgi:acetolactate synthase-1/2/3 large subunit